MDKTLSKSVLSAILIPVNSVETAASVVHSKLDYCNSLYYNRPKSQINSFQLIQNCLARTVVKATKFSHITPIIRSLHLILANALN